MPSHCLRRGLLSRLIAFHPDRKALLVPLMKRAELVMADYEEWITSGGTSIVLSPTALEQNGGAESATKTSEG